MDLSCFGGAVCLAAIVMYVRFRNALIKPYWLQPQPKDPLVTYLQRQIGNDPTGMDPVDDPESTSVMLDLGEL